jgi:hypothetical protein
VDIFAQFEPLFKNNISYICLINYMDVLSLENFQGFSKLNPKGVTYIVNNFPIFIVVSILNNVVTYNSIFYTSILTYYSLFYDIRVNFIFQNYVCFNMFLFKCLSLTFQFACDVQKNSFIHERKNQLPFPPFISMYICTYKYLHACSLIPFNEVSWDFVFGTIIELYNVDNCNNFCLISSYRLRKKKCKFMKWEWHKILRGWKLHLEIPYYE